MLEETEDIKKIVKIKNMVKFLKKMRLEEFNSENDRNQKKWKALTFSLFSYIYTSLSSDKSPPDIRAHSSFTHSLQELFPVLYPGTVQRLQHLSYFASAYKAPPVLGLGTDGLELTLPHTSGSVSSLGLSF